MYVVKEEKLLLLFLYVTQIKFYAYLLLLLCKRGNPRESPALTV